MTSILIIGSTKIRARARARAMYRANVWVMHGASYSSEYQTPPVKGLARETRLGLGLGLGLMFGSGGQGAIG